MSMNNALTPITNTPTVNLGTNGDDLFYAVAPGDQYDQPIGPDRPAANDLVQRVRDFITDYCVLPGDHYADILALYVFHTHAFDTARTTPYIYLTSKGPGSGKTRVMELLQELCRNSEMFSGMTGPVLFRMIEAIKPTLFLDEVDTIYSGAKNEELRGVLNGGYKHNGRIPRLERGTDEVRYFSTFNPKVLAGIDNGQVPATVLDRSIKIVMEKRDGEVAPYYAEDVEDIAADLQDELRAWATANAEALRDRTNRPAPIDGLTDRQNDIARPLLTIAQRIPGWYQRARRAFAHAFAAQETPLAPPAEALLKLRDYLRNHPDMDRITSAKATEVTGHNGKQLGLWFGAFDIQAPRVLKIDGKTCRGWETRDFATAFDRFLPKEVK